MKRMLEKLSIILHEIYRQKLGKNISPYLLKEADEKIKEILEHQKKIYKLQKKHYIMHNKESLSSWLLEMSLNLQGIESDLISIHEILTDFSISVGSAPSISPDADVEAAAQIIVCKKIEGSIRLLDIVPEGILFANARWGLTITDNELKLKKIIYLFEGLHIDRILKKFSYDELLLPDYGNKIIVHVTLQDGSYSIIRAPNIPPLGPLYWWTDNEALVSDCTGNLWAIDIEKKSIRPISTKYRHKNYQTFYEFFEHAKQYRIVWAEPQGYIFTYLDRYKKVAGVVNFIKQTHEIIENVNEDVFTVLYYMPRLFLVGTETIEFKHVDGTYRGILRSKSPFGFTSATITPGFAERLIVASSTKYTLRSDSALTIYKLV
jgi:hypothetical protein